MQLPSLIPPTLPCLPMKAAKMPKTAVDTLILGTAQELCLSAYEAPRQQLAP